MERTCGNGTLRLADAGKKVTLIGWVQRRRNFGALVFIDLRDRSGLVQVVFDETMSDSIKDVRSEYILQVTGTVVQRKEANPKMETGEIEVPVVGINETLREFGQEKIDFASIDVEGFDLQIISAWDFDAFRPFLFCIETGVITKGRHVKDAAPYDIMRDRGYRPLFETFANTIFVDANADQDRAT